MEEGAQNKRFWAKIRNKTQYFADLPTLQLTETLDFGQIIGLNGQIHIVTKEVYSSWLATKKRAPQPPKIQLDLQKAQWINDELATSPNQSALARRIGIDRTSLIRTLNLNRLDLSIKNYIMQLRPDTKECPLTKKHLRHLATNEDPRGQQQQFKELIDSIRSKSSQDEKIPVFQYPVA